MDGDYSPHRTSVQRLADNANLYGSTLSNGEDTPVWVGSPLRVHRRCIEPMFSWSNHIAYDGKMVFGLESREKPNGRPIVCDSVWIDIKGKTRRRQEVPEQTQFMVLGADKEHAGAAVWASSKPNILNVALTRAKRRFYLVGDRQLWGAMGSFQWSVGKLASKHPDEFLALVRNGVALEESAANH